MSKTTLDANLYLTSDGKRFKEGEPFNGFLWKLKGQEVDEEELKAHPVAEAKSIEEPPHNKAVHRSHKKHEG